MRLPKASPRIGRWGACPRLMAATRRARQLFDVCVPRVARALRFGLLPLALVANGHSFFVQLQLQTGVWPHASTRLISLRTRRTARASASGCVSGGCGSLTRTSSGRGAAPPAPVARVSRGGCAPPLEEVAAAAEAPWRRRRRPSALILDDDVGAADGALVPWVPSDPHAWSRQHVAHLEATRQRLADGVLLARVLNRTVVLPQFHCHCDKYWGRLAQCTIPHLAHPLASQPLPFVCPVDHVVPVSGWHGNWAARSAAAAAALPGRADGPPTTASRTAHTVGSRRRGGGHRTSRGSAARSCRPMPAWRQAPSGGGGRCTAASFRRPARR